MNKLSTRYVVDIQNKKISIHQNEDFKIVYFNTIDDFIYSLKTIRETNNTIWYVIPPGLIDKPRKRKND